MTASVAARRTPPGPRSAPPPPITFIAASSLAHFVMTSLYFALVPQKF